jgi:site-specific recombinase XerD
MRVYALIVKSEDMQSNKEILVTTDETRSTKDERHRVSQYADWLTTKGLNWQSLYLNEYRDFLLNTRKLKMSSVAAHIRSIKARYRQLLEDAKFLDQIRHAATSPDEENDFLRQTVKQLREDIGSEAGRVEVEREIEVFRLSRFQIDQLLTKPDLATPQGVRDMAMIGLMYCAGISETELCSLEVPDVYQIIDGEPAIYVRKSSTSEEARLVPLYDDLLFNMRWVQTFLYRWLEAMEIRGGRAFLGFSGRGQYLSNKPLTARGVQKMLKGYPLQSEPDSEFTVTALDLRRAYARQTFLAGVELDHIQTHLAHRNKRTTLEYVGLPDVGKQEKEYIGDGMTLLIRLSATTLKSRGI